MLTKPITVSSKGQIAIPKAILKRLGSKLLRLEITNDNEVKIVPVTNVAGSLANYARNYSGNYSDSRDEAWNKEVISRFKLTKKHD